MNNLPPDIFLAELMFVSKDIGFVSYSLANAAMLMNTLVVCRCPPRTQSIAMGRRAHMKETISSESQTQYICLLISLVI